MTERVCILELDCSRPTTPTPPHPTSGTAVSSRVMASYRLLQRPHLTPPHPTPPCPSSLPPSLPPSAGLVGLIAPQKTNIGLIPRQKGQAGSALTFPRGEAATLISPPPKLKLLPRCGGKINCPPPPDLYLISHPRKMRRREIQPRYKPVIAWYTCRQRRRVAHAYIKYETHKQSAWQRGSPAPDTRPCASRLAICCKSLISGPGTMMAS